MGCLCNAAARIRAQPPGCACGMTSTSDSPCSYSTLTHLLIGSRWMLWRPHPPVTLPQRPESVTREYHTPLRTSSVPCAMSSALYVTTATACVRRVEAAGDGPSVPRPSCAHRALRMQPRRAEMVHRPHTTLPAPSSVTPCTCPAARGHGHRHGHSVRCRPPNRGYRHTRPGSLACR